LRLRHGEGDENGPEVVGVGKDLVDGIAGTDGGPGENAVELRL
jgi:hypothetical protein